MIGADPFKLIFDIHSRGNIKPFPFISHPNNVDRKNVTEEVSLSKWKVDSVSDIFVNSDNRKELIRYSFNTSTGDLSIYWHNYTPKEGDKLVIKFYSVAYQRDKLISELFDENNEN